MIIKYLIIVFSTFSLISCKSNSCNVENSNYQNKKNKEESLIIPINEDTIYEFIKSIPVPDDYRRIEVDSNSYAAYLRNLPLKKDKTVYLFSGERKYNQNVQFAVVDIDVGTRDLQQCADAVMRLRGEYLFSQKQFSEIHFNFLSDGKPRYFTDYAGGDFSHNKFRKYMDYIFAYANTGSLLNELENVNIENMKIGDVFIQKGTPYGHAITVVDMAENFETGEKIFMIAQSYMPAQDIHILKNLNNSKLSPWYTTDFGEELYTPEWIFTKDDLRRF